MRTETEQSIAKALVNGQKYDEACKEVFKNREIIAPILKYVVKEFNDCTQEEIIKYIDADSIRETVPVSDLPATIRDQGTEMTSIFEKTIHYDVHFKVKNLKLSSGMISVMLHIDFEVQNDYKPSNPKYPIIKRAIYYAAREISAQLGILTNKTNYSDIEKVYSIWVCNENIPLDQRNTVTRYFLKKEDVIGRTDEPESDYDLLEIILIRRGDESTDEEIFQYLESIFRSDIAKIKEYVDIIEGSEVEKEVAQMTGLGESLYNKAYEEAQKNMAVKMVRKNYLRDGNEENAITDLCEELDLTYEQALEVFEGEIRKN